MHQGGDDIGCAEKVLFGWCFSNSDCAAGGGWIQQDGDHMDVAKINPCILPNDDALFDDSSKNSYWQLHIRPHHDTDRTLIHHTWQVLHHEFSYKSFGRWHYFHPIFFFDFQLCTLHLDFGVFPPIVHDENRHDNDVVVVLRFLNLAGVCEKPNGEC